MAFLLVALLLVAPVPGLQAQPTDGSPAPFLESVEPSVVLPNRPLDLVLHGGDFRPGDRVEIETAIAGRFLRFEPAQIEASTIRLRLPLGFGLRPATRRIRVVSSGGEATRELMLRIDRRGAAVDASNGGSGGSTEADLDGVDGSTEPDAAATEGHTGDGEPGDDGPGDDGDLVADGPRISSLWPTTLPTGHATRLEVAGEGFVDGARVLVEVNVNAGSSRLPEYAPKAFDAELIDEITLEVRFDRGFFPQPAVRDLWVRNPDGRESPPALLRLAAGQGSNP